MIFKTSAADRSANQALIAEISPAMMQKLRRDWRQSSSLLGVLLLVGGFHLIGQTKPFTLFSENGLSIIGVSSLVMGAAALCVAFFGQSLAVHEELEFRRHHGKWRWER